MADITKCSGTGCPIKDTCYRFRALANDYYQSWFSEEPYNHKAGYCESYWKIYDQRKSPDQVIPPGK